MLAELVEYLLTPSPPLARRLGYLKEAVAIRARARRCRAAWAGHLARCRTAVLEAARSSPGRGLAQVLGSGALLDIPVEELSAMFDQVVLADLVHPLAARLRVRNLRNVSLRTIDLTGVLAEVDRGRLPGRVPVDLHAGLETDLPDLTVSANIMSQLPLLPVKRLAATGLYRPEELKVVARGLLEEHLALLERMPGVVCLITDTAWRDGDSVQDPLQGITLPEPTETWTWNIAPRPEAHPDRDVTHEVAAFIRKARF
jgi:hypothetical protein